MHDRVKVVKFQVLRFLQVNPDIFDLAFVSEATAAVQLAIECFQEYAADEKALFSYYYHKETGGALARLRESSDQYRCFQTDEEVDRWIDGDEKAKLEPQSSGLFVYSGQSSFDGRRLPRGW